MGRWQCRRRRRDGRTTHRPHHPVTDVDLAWARTILAIAVADHATATDLLRVRPTTPGGTAVAQVNLRVCGAPARVEITGTTPAEAITAAANRLAAHLDRLTRPWQPWQWPDPHRPPPPAPPGQATSNAELGTAISRVKAAQLVTGPPYRAIAILHAMDYDALLYTDADTGQADIGQDAIAYRAGPQRCPVGHGVRRATC